MKPYHVTTQMTCYDVLSVPVMKKLIVLSAIFFKISQDVTFSQF